MTMGLKIGLQLFLACLISVVVCSSAHAQRTIPKLTGPVVDEAGILSETTERQLTSIINAHEDSTSNQLVVLTIASLEGANLEDYSLTVARTWELGQADKNNGVLLLVAVAERKIRIEVGYGLEGDLPDIMANRIIEREITPHFREGNFDRGISLGVQRMLDAIEGSYVVTETSDFMDSFGLRLQVGFLLLIFPMLILGASTLKSCIALVVAALFVTPFIFIAGFIIWPPFGGFLLVSVAYGSLLLIRKRLQRSEKWGPIMESIAKIKPGEVITFDVNGWTWTYRGADLNSGSRSSSGGYSSGSSFSSSSSGFSGGGGSFGGGGASGSW